MSGKRAKAIRRMVYGDMADVRKYRKSLTGTITAGIQRKTYQVAKGR